MTPSSNCAVPESTIDPVLAAAVDVARAAAAEEAGTDPVGTHVGVDPEPGGAATHLFEAELAGYRGWRWAVTVASAGPDTSVSVSEVVLLPGPDALTAPEWVPWQQRVKAGDLGVGDLMPTEADDPRLVPSYLGSDDPAVEEVEHELGLGRVRVMSRFGRLDAADRWQGGDFGPRSEMARSAPDRCGRCGFYLPIGGSLRAAFGVCGNELAPADGRVVHVEYGCGAHSEVELEMASPVPVADLVYDDTTMDVEPALSRQSDVETPAVETPIETAVEVPVEATVEDVVADVQAEEPAADEAVVDEIVADEAVVDDAVIEEAATESADEPVAEVADEQPVVAAVEEVATESTVEPAVEPTDESVGESTVEPVAEITDEPSEPAGE